MQRLYRHWRAASFLSGMLDGRKLGLPFPGIGTVPSASMEEWPFFFNHVRSMVIVQYLQLPIWHEGTEAIATIVAGIKLSRACKRAMAECRFLYAAQGVWGWLVVTQA